MLTIMANLTRVRHLKASPNCVVRPDATARQYCRIHNGPCQYLSSVTHWYQSERSSYLWSTPSLLSRPTMDHHPSSTIGVGKCKLFTDIESARKACEFRASARGISPAWKVAAYFQVSVIFATSPIPSLNIYDTTEDFPGSLKNPLRECRVSLPQA
jgi:hypothetical protein